MKNIATIQEACQALLELDVCWKTEQIPVSEAYGRVLAERFLAEIAVPSFRKSAYDGYALRRADIQRASADLPVTLAVTETIPAGHMGKYPITEGKAARIMTGAMIPEGADAVVKHEDTRFTADEVRFFAPVTGSNIVEVGEDVHKGTCLISCGKLLGAAECGILAGQGRAYVCVYKQPEVAVISTGSELIPLGQALEDGKIYNSNVSLLSGYLKKYGMIPNDWGIAADEIRTLADRVASALNSSDLVITTGGVSAGDFDYVHRALEEIGAKVLFHRLPFKPGGAMLAAVKDGKVILGLSGNPGAAAVGLLRIGLPYMKKLCGRAEVGLAEAEAVLKEPFPKSSKGTRFLTGQAEIEDGRLVFCLTGNQKNGSVSSMLDCNLLGEIPAGSPALAAGARIKVYFL